jgi:hypothetical protein
LASPIMRRVTRPRPGSALRLSQPLSGFPASHSFAALFRAATIRGTCSLQSLSLTESANPSRGRLLPCSHPPTCFGAPPKTFHREFPRRPRFHAVACFPSRLWSSFPQLSCCFPVLLSLKRRIHRFSPASPTSEPYSSCESVSTEPGCPAPATDTLLGFTPLKFSPPTPRVLNPLAPEDTNTHLAPKDSTRDPGDLTTP